MFYIGSLRRFLFMPFSCKWNAWVRDITAKYEGTWLIRSSQGKISLKEFRYCFGESDGPFSCKECGVLTWKIYSEHDHENSRDALQDGVALCEKHEPIFINSRKSHTFPQ